jgi:hypothetical protein
MNRRGHVRGKEGLTKEIKLCLWLHNNNNMGEVFYVLTMV